MTAQLPIGKPVFGRYAVAHDCPDGGVGGCVTLMDVEKGPLGCYQGNMLLGRTGDVCFKDHFSGSLQCQLPGCSEHRPHIHVHSQADGVTDIANSAMIQCASCTAQHLKPGAHLQVPVGDSVTTKIDCDGICCPSEVPVIEKALAKMQGVQNINVNVTAKQVTVVHNPNLCKDVDLVDALNRASMNARLKRADGALDGLHDRFPSPLLLLSGVLWVISLAHLASPDEDSWMKDLKYVGIAAIVMGLPRIVVKAVGALRNSVLDINCLMTLATCGAVATGDYAEGAAVVFLFGLSEWLENMASASARNALRALLDMKPEEAILTDGRRVPVEAVKVGDKLQVLSGGKVPVDGTVLSGSSTFDESALTGESRPVQKLKGSEVSAGTVNVGGGFLEIEATAVSSDSMVAKMVKLIEDANASRSRTEKRVEYFAKIYTPAVIFAALLLAVVPWFFVAEDAAWEYLYTALVLLVVACPCALVISTPMTYVCTLTTAASHGILIRGGEHLEAMGSVAVMGLDKTGTLTEGRFRVRQQLGPFMGQKDASEWPKLLSLMAAVEQKSHHPVAAALVAHCREGGAKLDRQAAEVVERPGEGVEAIVDGKVVNVGSRRLAQRMGWLNMTTDLRSAGRGSSSACCFPSLASARPLPSLDPEIEKQVSVMEGQGFTVCYLGIDGCLAAIFGVADAPRAETPAAMRGLGELGIESVMLTGDRQKTAEVIAMQLGVGRVQAELLPQDKVSAVQALKKERSSFRWLGGVAMVGDGVNDAAAMAASTVGVAMGAAGTQVAVETAHVVLMDSDLTKLVLAVRLGRHAVGKIKQNIAFSIVSKAAMLVLTFSGFASLWGAILADLGAMLIVTVNSSTVMSMRKQIQKQQAHMFD